jgi:hypothetical protein
LKIKEKFIIKVSFSTQLAKINQINATMSYKHQQERPQPHYKSIEQLKAGFVPTKIENRLPNIVFTG